MFESELIRKYRDKRATCSFVQRNYPNFSYLVHGDEQWRAKQKVMSVTLQYYAAVTVQSCTNSHFCVCNEAQEKQADRKGYLPFLGKTRPPCHFHMVIKHLSDSQRIPVKNIKNIFINIYSIVNIKVKLHLRPGDRQRNGGEG